MNIGSAQSAFENTRESGNTSASVSDVHNLAQDTRTVNGNGSDSDHPLKLVNLKALMGITTGSAEVKVGLIDGPVFTSHPELSSANLQELPRAGALNCSPANLTACSHATFIAGILSARRGSGAPAICPGCTVLMRPVFANSTVKGVSTPSATPDELARAIMDCIDAGVQVINLSLSLSRPVGNAQPSLKAALDQAARRGVIVVAAAGNQAMLGSTAITGHPWVIPVVGCDLQGKVMQVSNIGLSIGRNGLSAPGERVTSLGIDDQPAVLGGTSVSVPFVVGAIALLRSAIPAAEPMHIKLALCRAAAPRRVSIVPPLLNAAAAYRLLYESRGMRAL